MNEPLNLSQFTRLRESLTIGDVVSVAFTISRERWKQNAGIALQATAWLFVPVVGWLFINANRSGSAAGRSGASGMMVVWLVVALYCLGQYTASSALISRLVFNDLTQQSESLADARRFTQSRMWSYLGVSLLMGLLYSAVGIVVTIALGLLVFGISGVGFLGLSRDGGTLIILSLVAMLFASVGLFIGLLRLGSRLFFYEVPMSVERETGAAASIGRTWSLGRRSTQRLVNITLLAFLTTLPIQAIAQVVTRAFSRELTAMSALVFLTVNFVATVVLIVFWQAVKAVVYFDLRNQAEGMGLELR